MIDYSISEKIDSQNEDFGMGKLFSIWCVSETQGYIDWQEAPVQEVMAPYLDKEIPDEFEGGIKNISLMGQGEGYYYYFVTYIPMDINSFSLRKLIVYEDIPQIKELFR